MVMLKRRSRQNASLRKWEIMFCVKAMESVKSHIDMLPVTKGLLSNLEKIS